MMSALLTVPHQSTPMMRCRLNLASICPRSVAKQLHSRRLLHCRRQFIAEATSLRSNFTHPLPPSDEGGVTPRVTEGEIHPLHPSPPHFTPDKQSQKQVCKQTEQRRPALFCVAFYTLFKCITYSVQELFYTLAKKSVKSLEITLVVD